MINPAKRCPEDVEFLCRMAWEFGATYFDAVWAQREAEQDERNKARAVERERLGALLATVRRPVTKATEMEMTWDGCHLQKIDLRTGTGVTASGKIAACV